MTLYLPGAPRRKDGEEHPHIKAGIFKIRIPFWHLGIEIPELFQALAMFVTGLGAIALLQDLFGISFELSLTIVCIHELLYCMHQLLGDPVISGWITPAIPITTAFLLNFVLGPERIQALIALQIMVGVIFFVLGTTGIAKKLLKIIPKALQAGVILGAGVSAIIGKYCFSPTSDMGFNVYPISMTVGGLLALYLLFSKLWKRRVETSSTTFIKIIAQYGMVPGIIAGIITGWITGEIALPQFGEGLFFIPHFGELFSKFNIFAVGIPSIDIWVRAIPMAIIAYIIAFGDMIIGQTVINDANKNFRLDEEIDNNPNRLNLFCGIRNILEGCISPIPTLGGPVWAAMTVAVAERYKLGRKAMDSIFSGSGTFNIFKFLSCLVLPLVAIFKPALPLAMSLTLLIQAFACTYISMRLLEDNVDFGVAGITAGVLAVGGPAYGLAVGLILSLVLIGPKSFRMDDDLIEQRKKSA